MYNKITHKLDRVFSKIQVGDSFKTSLFNIEGFDTVHTAYDAVKVVKKEKEMITIKKIGKKELFIISRQEFSQSLLNGELQFEQAQHITELKENDNLMWLGEEYMENGCQYYVGQRFQVLSIDRNAHLTSVTLLTHRQNRKFNWKIANEMLIDGKLIVVRTELGETFGVV